MRQFDIFINPPQLKNPDDQREVSAAFAKLQEILQFISDNLGVLPVVSSAPTVNELQEKADAKGEIRSEVKILDDNTQSSRRLYYKKNGNLRYLESD